MTNNIYQSIVDAHFQRLSKDREPDGFFHPSSLTDCDRKAVYEQTGTERTDPTQPRNTRIMARGTQMHEEVQAMMHAEFPGFLDEVELTLDDRVVGTCDGLLPVGDGPPVIKEQPDVLEPVYELQEYKSIGPIGKRYLKGKPRPEHVQQARIYYMALRRMNYLLTEIIRIVYFDRDDWSVLEFEVKPWSEEEEETFLVKLDDLQAHALEGSLPERMPDDYWLCRYCPYATRCRQQDGDYARND